MNDQLASNKPAWLKVRAPGSAAYLQTREIVKRHQLHTVCEEAHCPNIGECWSQHTATFMILGDECTRCCRFCAVKGPTSPPPPPDPAEPERVGRAAAELQLKHVVITSVTRDDLADGGAAHFAATVQAVHRQAPDCQVELLIPDLQGRRESLQIILAANVAVLSHNLETVPRLYSEIRPGAEYRRSLQLLQTAKELQDSLRTKSGIMVGLGEDPAEVLALMDDLRNAQVDGITIGQYLAPSKAQVPIREYIPLELFTQYQQAAYARGFSFVKSAPLVRSSYQAAYY